LDHWRGERRRPLPVEQLPEPVAREQADGDPELWTAVGSLPPMQRAAVIHRYVLDLPYAEIADALGISEEAARANTYEGRRKLRSMQEVTA
jgi:RNA polymerase sigma factor (sigma-70 family)